jgi:hypothetical protein
MLIIKRHSENKKHLEITISYRPSKASCILLRSSPSRLLASRLRFCSRSESGETVSEWIHLRLGQYHVIWYKYSLSPRDAINCWRRHPRAPASYDSSAAFLKLFTNPYLIYFIRTCFQNVHHSMRPLCAWLLTPPPRRPTIAPRQPTLHTAAAPGLSLFAQPVQL